ncbi:MAG: AsmA family protein [Alphaproteobacteria bacterium]
MKKLLAWIGSTLGLFIVIVVVAALILPSFILKQYEDKIVAMIKEQTGRDIQLGEMSLRLLPSPQLRVENAVIPSVEGAAEPEFAKMDSLRVNVAILPIITKTVKIKNIELINPNVVAEILPDGSNNWTFTPKKQASETQDTTKETQKKSSNFKVVVSDIKLKGGEVIYINRKPDARQLLSATNVNLSAGMDSLTGPFRANGDLNWNSQKFDIALKTGKLEGQKPSRFDVTLGVGKDNHFKFDGQAAIKPKILVSGNIDVQSANPAALVQELGLNISGLPSAPVALKGSIQSDDTSGKTENMKLSLGSSSLEASADWKLGDTYDINAMLRGKTINVDQILTSLAKRSTTKQEAEPKPQTVAKSDDTTTVKTIEIPSNINLNLDAQIQRIIYNQQDVSNMTLQAQMKDGLLSVSNASAVLPGSSPIGASFTMDAADANIKGSFNFTSERLKDLVAWVGGDVSKISDDRFKKLNIRSDIAGNLEKISLSNIQGQIDESQIAGGVVVALKPLKAALDLQVNQVQLDPWIAAFSQPKTKKVSMNNPVVSKAYAAQTSKALIPLDLDLKLAIDSLVYQGMNISGVGTDMTIINDNLSIKNAHIYNLAGAQIGATGAIHDLGGTQTAKDLKISLKASSLEGLFKLANIKNIPANKIGATTGNVTANGSLKNNVTLSAALQALGGSYGAKGTINPKNVSLGALDFVLQHKNLNQVTAVFAPTTKLPAGVQSVNLKGHVELGKKKYALSKLSGSIGSSTIKSGSLTADLSASKPYISANLATGTLNVDALQGGESKVKAKTAQASQRKAGTPPWSDDVIDFSALNSINADVALAADKIIFSGKNLSNVQLKASLKDGLLNISNLAANAYDGKLQFSGKVDNRSGGAIGGNVSVQNLSLSSLAKDMAGVKLPIGRLQLTTNLNMSGNTSRKLVSSLAGDGSFKVSGLGGQSSGSQLDSFLSIIQTMGSASGSGALGVEGQMKANAGILNLSSLNLSGLIGGHASGNINLPQWTLDIAGAFTLLDTGVSKLVLAALNKENLSGEHEFRVNGSIDSPNMELPSDLQKALNLYKGASDGDVKSLLSGGVSDALLDKLGVSSKDSSLVEGLISGLGGSSSKGQSTTKDAAKGAAQEIINNLVGGSQSQETSNQSNDSSADAVGDLIGGILGGDSSSSDNVEDAAKDLIKGLFN